MPVSPKSCFEVVCDLEGQDPRCDGGWEDGAVHFPTRQEATDYAREYGFLIEGTLVLCPPCKVARECELAGHRWGDWDDSEHRGVQFQRRYCEHCGSVDYSPEHDQVVAVVLAEDILRDAARAAGYA